MTIFNQIIGSYSQTIRIGRDKNEVEVSRNGREIFKGEAKNILDTNSVLSFIDATGRKYEIVKYQQYTIS